MNQSSNSHAHAMLSEIWLVWVSVWVLPVLKQFRQPRHCPDSPDSPDRCSDSALVCIVSGACPECYFCLGLSLEA